jgi:hypothetical protein
MKVREAREPFSAAVKSVCGVLPPFFLSAFMDGMVLRCRDNITFYLILYG